ncbi:GVIN1 GTPase, partial [Brachypodius atriceps]|nr:GVIN1 GTPase [Brachypodius atriceps]
GLDAGYWLPKVMQILGNKCLEALQHLEYKDYLKMECEVQHPWEKKALQKLLKVTDGKTTAEQVQKEHLEKTKERQEVAKQALSDLTEMLSSCSHSQDAVRKKAETLWQAMEIPKEFWPPPKKPLVDVLESIQKQLEQQELSAVRVENIPDTEVLRRASGGLALQGIYRSSRPEDVLAKREQLLRVPEGFQLAGPEQGSLLERKEFSSSAAESTFTKFMEQLGFSISVSAKANFWKILLRGGVDHSRSSHSRSQRHCRAGAGNTSVAKNLCVSLCVCLCVCFYYKQLESEVRHSWEKKALQKLLKIRDQVSSINVEQIFQADNPLDKSPKVTHPGDLIKTLQQMKEHIHAATDAPGSSASAVHEEKKKIALTSSLAIYSLLQSLQERTQKDMELLVLLIATSTGYQVESSTFQHLLGHPEIQYMAKEMEAAHEEYMNLKEQDSDRAEASLLLRGLTVTPERQELSPEQKREHLAFLEDHMKGLWSTRVNNLLQKHSAAIDWERLERDLNSLISGCLDDKWDEEWMQIITGHPLPRSPKVSELGDLIKTLQQMKEHIHAVTYAPGSSASAVHEAKIEATMSSSLAIYSLLQSLQEQDQKDMELLVLLIVTSTGYQVESSTFQHLLGHPEIQYMAKEMEAAHEEYVNLKEQDSDRAEASLLLTGLTVTTERQELSPEQKRERLAFMEDHMKGLWSPQIKNLLQKHRKGTDWERLEMDLNSLISGCLDDRWDEERMQIVVRDLEDTFPTADSPSQSQSKSDGSESKANEAIANQEFLWLLKRLGLENHYPRKMGMGDFHTISKTSLQDSQPSKDIELPLYFLQKLLTMDYQVRYLTCWDESY